MNFVYLPAPESNATGAESVCGVTENAPFASGEKLIAGTTLFLPVWADGALFSAGDGHAVQGDGEVNLMALETPMSGTFELILHKGKSLTFPRATTPTHYIAMGTDPDLDLAGNLLQATSLSPI